MYRLMENVPNTSNSKPGFPYNDWKEFWVVKTGKRWPSYCAIAGCNDRADVGAHVRMAGQTNSAVYIAPMCYGHNNDHDAKFYIDDSMLLRIK